MPKPRPATATRLALALAAAALAPALASAQGNYPVTGQQRATAQQVAQAGVALSELAENAPDSHTVQRGDTLWDISKLFLKKRKARGSVDGYRARRGDHLTAMPLISTFTHSKHAVEGAT